MPRSTSFTKDQLVERALQHFWVQGFHALSMDDLVKATGVSRHGIYATFGGKRSLFLACFDQYQKAIVTPAFKIVEAPTADLQSIYDYFEKLITLGETVGLPGPGCFVANSATEVAPDDPDVMKLVEFHNNRLRLGFEHALRNSKASLDQETIAALANVIVIFTNGLWTMSRSVGDGDVLRQSVRTFLNLLMDTTE